MFSLKFLVGTCLLLGFYILELEVRSSYAMPIQEDKNRDRFDGIYNLITQRLQNLTKNTEENNLSVRRSFIPMNSVMIQNSTEGNTFDTNSAFDAQTVKSPSTFLTNKATLNTGQTGAPLFSGSFNSPPPDEDRSSIYTNLQVEPTTYDRKNTIYRQNLPAEGQQRSAGYGRDFSNSYGRISPGSSHLTRARIEYPVQETRSYQNNQLMGYRPSYYKQRYYPGYQQQKSWPGYQARPGYQIRYPGLSPQTFAPSYDSSETVTRDNVPIRQWKEQPVNNDAVNTNVISKTSGKITGSRFTSKSTIRSNLPDGSVTQSSSQLPEESVTQSSPPLQFFPAAYDVASSGSGSAVVETSGMENTDQQVSQEISGSGSGSENISDVAFMLAGTSDDTPRIKPVNVLPGLPVNLTRQQALDVYKSALYFAGLLREESLEDSATSGDDHTSDDDNDDAIDGKVRDDSTVDDVDDDDDDDDAVNITDNDVKEALLATSGDQESSGQQTSDVENSGGRGEAASSEPPKEDKAAHKQDTEPRKQDSQVKQQVKQVPKAESESKQEDNKASKHVSETEKEDSEPQKEGTEETDVKAAEASSESSATSSDSEAEKSDSAPSTQSADSEGKKGDSETSSSSVDSETEKADSETPPPSADSVKEKAESEAPPPSADSETEKTTTASAQAVESVTPAEGVPTTQSSDNTPPADQELNQVQSNNPAVQQAQAPSPFFSNARQAGVYSSTSQRSVICKDTIQRIACPPEQRIRILNADYGDTGNVGCLKESNPMPAGMCRTPGTYETVKRRCEGHETCDLAASNDWFGDECPDSNKYLDVNYDCMNNIQPYTAPNPGYAQAPQYVNPAPPPVNYAPAPYPYPSAGFYSPPAAPAAGLPDLLPPSPYVAPNPCDPCNTCAQCSLPVCGACTQSCHTLTCGPHIPAKLQPLWQQWNERTADMNQMEMSALIISPVPKLLAPTKAPAATTPAEAEEGSESGDTYTSTDEDAFYDDDSYKRSGIQRLKQDKKSKKTAHKQKDDKSNSEQGFLVNSDLMVSSGDTSSGSST